MSSRCLKQLFIICVILSGCRQTAFETADLILYNGVFYTLDNHKSIAEAVAIKGDRIVAVGSGDAVRRYAGDETQSVDMEGRFGCPGFNDAHIDVFPTGYGGLNIDLNGMTSVREIQRRILDLARGQAPSTWITGRGWDQSLFNEDEWPTSRILDRVAPSVPIYLERVCGTVAWVNGRALRIAGITANTPDPPRGIIVMDPRTQHPTGILKGEAMQLVRQFMPPRSDEEDRRSLLAVLRKLPAHGITSIQTSCTIEDKDKLLALIEAVDPPCRVSLNFPLKANTKEYLTMPQHFAEGKLRFGYLELMLDGCVGSHTAFFTRPYMEDPGSRGIANLSRDQLGTLVIDADKKEYQLGIHASGDAANHLLLEAYTMARTVNGKRDARHRIVLAQVLREEDLDMIDGLDIVVSIQPTLLLDDLRWMEKRIGAERSRYAHAWRSMKSHGAALAIGSGWPASSMNPMVGLFAAVARTDTTGYPHGGWNPRERLTVDEAIEAYTLGSAYAEFMDHEKGSLEPGKYADIVILSRNLLECPPEDVLKTEVVLTILGGKVVYRKEGGL